MKNSKISIKMNINMSFILIKLVRPSHYKGNSRIGKNPHPPRIF